MKTITSYLKIFCIGILLGGLTILSSCKKSQSVASPSFDVTLDPAATYTANSPVVFKVTGDADVVTFYSGVNGSQYVNKDRNVVQGTPQMQFTSYMQYGPQSNTIHLLVSKDFNNAYDVPDVQSATWTDITSRATFSSGTDNTASGVVDLSDIVTGDEPVFIAFKYTAVQSTVSQPTWTIKNIAISNKLADGTLAPVATSANISWGGVNVLGTQVWTTSTAQIQMAGGAIGTPDNEDWCITQRLFLDRVTPDLGVNVKSSPTSIPLPTYSFTYTTAGTYTATFVAQNNSAWDKKTIVKQFTITVK